MKTNLKVKIIGMKTIKSEMAPIGNIGQMKINRAPSEVERMQRQTGQSWRTDFSDILISRDDPTIDEDARGWHRKQLSKGNCWVVCDEYTQLIEE